MPPGSVYGENRAAPRGQSDRDIPQREGEVPWEKRDAFLSGGREAAGKPGFARIKMGKHHGCYGLPPGLRRFCRAFNHIERLNREVKCRSSVLGIFPPEEPLVRGAGKRRLEGQRTA